MARSAAHLFFAFVLALCLAVTACTDRNPAALPNGPAPTLPPAAMAMLTCTVSVRDASLTCRPAEAPALSGVSAAVIGGDGLYVRITSTGVRYDGTSVFRADVTVENLTAEALGTADGVTPSANGVRVFFHSPPVATEGTGAVEVANADGEGFFTAAAQKYFRYDGILPPGGTSAAREWRFTVPSTVANFSFGVYVAAPVRAEEGWLSLTPLAPTLYVGWTIPMRAMLRNLADQEVAGQPVLWTTSDASVATVDAQGKATAVGVGTATLTASSGGYTASARLVVSAGSTPITTVSYMGVSKRWVVADGRDTLRFEADAWTAPASSNRVYVYVRHPDGSERVCPQTFTAGQCNLALPEGSLGGAWRIERVRVENRAITHEELVAAGAPAFIYVRSANVDRTAPTIDFVGLSTPAVTGADSVRWTVRATDDLVGVEFAEAWVSTPGHSPVVWYNPRLQIIGRTWVMHFVQAVQYYREATYTMDSIRVRDYNDNRRTLRTADLAARGFPTQFTVSGTTPDSIPPTITGFGFAPATIRGNGADSLTVTLSASEPGHESGVWFLDAEFEKVGDVTRWRRCYRADRDRALNRTMTCSETFGPADVGTWRVLYIRAFDHMNNSRVLDTQQMQAAGYPTDFTVTSP